MKKTIILTALAAGVLITSCRKIEVDSDGSGNNGNGNNNGNGSNTGQTITLKGRIDKDTVLRAGNNYILSGLVYMVNNATMKVEPGVTVKGDYTGANVAALVITRGAKLVADGNQNEPIVFTSNSPVPRSGDWGGIVICGKASVNATYTVQAVDPVPCRWKAVSIMPSAMVSRAVALHLMMMTAQVCCVMCALNMQAMLTSLIRRSTALPSQPLAAKQ
jgi:hypothetical protein